MADLRAKQPVDFQLLDEATRSLLGYFVHTWYRHYLVVITENFRRYFDVGLIEELATPSAAGRYTMLFDFTALNLEKLAYINGIYFYILSAHKGANHRLMNRFEGKQVLYLRGYDFEGSVATGGGLAAGFSSIDTQQFNWALSGHLAPHCQLFKVLAPKDVYWETVSAQRHFYGDFAGMIPLSRAGFVSVCLNALHWQDGVMDLLDRMDHYIVYVSSITQSVLWEMTQLDTDDRRGRVTIIFDDKAIENKELQLGVRDRMQSEYGDKLIWSKPGASPTQTVAELRNHLSSKFLVTTPDDFARDIEQHRRRISGSSSKLLPGARETWIDFRFSPALDQAKVKELRAISAWVDARISEWTGERGIDCLPLFLNLVQLQVFTTLLFGEHRETGRALAAYAAVMQGTLDYYTAPGEKPGELSMEGRERSLAALTDHLGLARDVGWCMLCYGKSHEFADFTAGARADFDAAFDRTKAAVDGFFAAAKARNAAH